MNPPESCGTISILACDEHLAIIDKPPAMLTHANSFDRHSPTVVNVLGSRLGRVYNVHRLDRMTTGAMVVARTPEAASELSRQLRDREVLKRYVAVVRGHVDDQGCVTVPIDHPSHGEEMEARTDYRALGRGRIAEPIGRYGEGWLSLVELTLHTGRSHQARRHMKRIDHPVIGDNKHGDKSYNRLVASRLGERHLYLRAHELRFRHPESGVDIHIRLGLPDLWIALTGWAGITVPPELLAAPGAANVQSGTTGAPSGVDGIAGV